MTEEKVPAARLAPGRCNHKGEGDIAESYSGDVIAFESRTRTPFRFNGALWVCVSMSTASAGAYRLVSPELFEGTQTTYSERAIKHGEEARNDPNGFYHGMVVTQGKNNFVLTGPEVRFYSDEAIAAPPADTPDTPVAEQASLF